MAATVRQQPAAPPRAAAAAAAAGGFFGFLKDGVAIATRNRGLFLPLAALHAARRTAFFHASTLAFRSFAAAVDDLEAYGDDVGGGTLLAVAGRWRLLLPAGAVYLVAHVTLGLAIDAAIATAAVAAAASSSSSSSCSSGAEGRHSTTTPSSSSLLVSLLAGKKAKGGNLVGPMATAVFAGAVGWGLAGVVWLPVLAGFPAVAYFGRGMVLLVLLLELAAFLFAFFYLYAVRAVAAEPGTRAAAAVGRARRPLMRGGRKLAQAALYSSVAWALDKAVWKMHAAWTRSGLSPPLGAVVVYCLLCGGLKVLRTATVTAYYFDCRRIEEEEKAWHAD